MAPTLSTFDAGSSVEAIVAAVDQEGVVDGGAIDRRLEAVREGGEEKGFPLLALS